MLIFSLIVIIVYNYINPNQNSVPFGQITGNKTINIPLTGLEEILESMDNNTEEYIKQKTTIDFYNLYNSYNENSWQRYALNEERRYYSIGNVDMDYHVIIMYLQTINDYELDKDSKITVENYEIAKEKYNKYVQLLNLDNWKLFVGFKIKDLTEKKKLDLIINEEIQKINLELEICELRLNNNIEFADNILNQYLEKYRINKYSVLYHENMSESNEQYIKNDIMQQKANAEIAKYAVENKVMQDVFYYNKVDARNSFIRTFENFDLIIIIIAIYISCTIVTEEVNKRTIKNLLTKPHKRATILMSKVFACVITVVIAMLFIAIAQYIVGGIIFGFDSYRLEFIGYDYNNEQIINMNLFSYILLVSLSKLPIYIIIILFCIFMSVTNNNMAMTMILTLIIFIIFSTVIAEWSKVETFSIVTRFFITNNWDFSTYLFGQLSDIEGVKLSNSIVIYLIYMLILLRIAIYTFNKKEINNR